MKLNFKSFILTLLLCIIGQVAFAQESWVTEVPEAKQYFLYNKAHQKFMKMNDNGAPGLEDNLNNATLFTITGAEKTDLAYTVGETTYYLYQDAGVYGAWKDKQDAPESTRSTASFVDMGYGWFFKAYNGGYQIYSNHKYSYSTGWFGKNKHEGDTDRYIYFNNEGTVSCTKNSDQYNTDNATWYLISNDQINEESARTGLIATFNTNKSNAGFDKKKVDASCFVVNRNIDWKGGWQTNVNNATLTYQNNHEYPTQYVEVFNDKGVKGKIYQTTSQTLPKGSYRMDITSAAHGQNSQSQSVYVYLKATTGNTKDGKQYIQSDNDPSKRNYSVFAYIDTDSPLEFGVEAIDNSSTWLSLDDVTLYYLGTNDVVAYYETLKAFRTAYNSLKNYATENRSRLPQALNTEIEGLISPSNTISTGETYGTLLTQNALYNEEALQTATASLENELTKVKQIESQYEHINNYLNIFQGSFPQEIASAKTDLENCTTLAALEAVLNTLRTNIAVSNYGAGTDLTILVKNNSFDMGTIQYWTSDNPAPAATATSGENGADGAFLYKGTAVLTQQIATGLKEGVYRVKAMVAGTDVKITLNNDAIENWVVTNTEFTNLKEDTARVIVPASGSLTIKISANGEFKVDNVQLQYLGATGQSKAGFEENMEEALKKVVGFAAGEYAPYNNIAAIAARTEVLRTYDKYVSSEAIPPYTEAETTQLLNDLAAWTQNSQKMNAVYDGDFAVQAENTTSPVDVKGWVSSGQAGLRQIIANTTSYPGLNEATNNKAMYVWGSQAYKYGTTEGYTMPLKANTGYVLSLKYAGWDGALNSLSASVLKGEEGLQTTYLGGAENGINTANSLVTKTVKFMTGEAGNYVLTLTPDGNAVFTDISIVEADKVNLTATVTDAKWGTFIAPFNFDLAGSNITAYICDGAADGILHLTKVANDGKLIPTNTPVILNSEAAANKTVSGYAMANEEYYTVGLLTGVYAPMEAPVGSYILANHEGQVGFYLVVENEQPTVGANRAFLALPESTSLDAFYFDTETAIEAVEALTTGKSEIYDLNGVKQQSLQKGINIVKLANGKTQKVLVK